MQALNTRSYKVNTVREVLNDVQIAIQCKMCDNKTVHISKGRFKCSEMHFSGNLTPTHPPDANIVITLNKAFCLEI